MSTYFIKIKIVSLEFILYIYLCIFGIYLKILSRIACIFEILWFVFLENIFVKKIQYFSSYKYEKFNRLKNTQCLVANVVRNIPVLAINCHFQSTQMSHICQY